MATTLYFRALSSNASDRWMVGARWASLAAGALVDWEARSLLTTRGAAASSLSASTVAGPTNGIEIKNSFPVLWLSPSLSADATIAGSITFNLRALESNALANAAINCAVYRVSGATGAFTLIHKTVRTTELGTGETAANFAETPAAGVTVHRGDRILCVPFIDDAGTMATGYTASLYYDGPTAAASGDSYVTFSETFSFDQTDPAGTTIYLTSSSQRVNGVTPSDEGLKSSDVFDSNIDGWTAEQWAGGYTNVAAIAYLGSDGSPSNGCLQMTCNGQFDQGFLKRLTGLTMRNGVLYTMTFRVKQSSGSGQIQWGLGDRTQADIYHGTSFSQTITGSWVERTLSFTPPMDIPDCAVWFCSAGAITSTVLIDSVTVVATGMGTRTAWIERGKGLRVESAWTEDATLVGGRPVQTQGDGPVDYYTPPLKATTLAGPVLAYGWFSESNAAATVAMLCEIAICNGDGSSPVLWGTNGRVAELSTGGTEHQWWVTGDDMAITEGQRIRVRFYFDSAQGVPINPGPMSSGSGTYYAAMWLDGNVSDAFAAGDCHLTFSMALQAGGASAPLVRSLIGAP